jgi:predicted transcriptional regulator
MNWEKLKENVQLVRLAAGDARCKTDHLRAFEHLILANESMYPQIERWYSQKVLPGIRSEERIAFVGYLDENPIVSALIKKGARSKFCHLRLHHDLHQVNLGEVIFSLMAFEIRDLASEIHFTVPESVWQSKGEFFRSFGFNATELSEKQYRLFDREFYCSARFEDVWRAVLEKLPKISSLYSFGGLSPENHLVLSIKPTYAEQIFAGKKRIEIRRKFSTRWVGHRMNIYSSAPDMSLVGEATISRVVMGTVEEIWQRFGGEIGCKKEEFLEYTKGAGELYAIELDNVSRYRAPISLAQISHLVREHLQPPQSYFTLEKNKPWAKAVSVAAYLHASVTSVFGSCFARDHSGRYPPEPAPRMIQGNFKLY